MGSVPPWFLVTRLAGSKTLQLVCPVITPATNRGLLLAWIAGHATTGHDNTNGNLLPASAASAAAIVASVVASAGMLLLLLLACCYRCCWSSAAAAPILLLLLLPPLLSQLLLILLLMMLPLYNCYIFLIWQTLLYFCVVAVPTTLTLTCTSTLTHY